MLLAVYSIIPTRSFMSYYSPGSKEKIYTVNNPRRISLADILFYFQPKGKGKFVFKNGYQQNGEYHITSTVKKTCLIDKEHPNKNVQNDEEDSEAPPQVQYKWIARDVTAINQEQPDDLDDDQAETNRIQGKFIS